MRFLSYQISDLFTNEASPLSKIVDKVNAIKHLQTCFEKLLPQTLIQQSRVGQYENGVLYLFTHSAAIATQLRFHVPQLLSDLRQDKLFVGLCSIQIKIAQHMPTPENQYHEKNAEKPSPPILSQENANALRQIAKGLEGKDAGTQALIKNLLKLAEHSK